MSSQYSICNGECLSEFEVARPPLFIRSEYLLRDTNELLFNEAKLKCVEHYLKSLLSKYPECMYRISDLDSSELMTFKNWDGFSNGQIPLYTDRGHRNSKYFQTHHSLEYQMLTRICKSPKVLIPMVKNLNEFEKIRNSLSVLSSKSVRMFTMVEVPSLLSELLSADLDGVEFDGIVVGMNDLTSLYYGTSREFGIEIDRALKDDLIKLSRRMKQFGKAMYIAGNLSNEEAIWLSEYIPTIETAQHLWQGWGSSKAKSRITAIKKQTVALKTKLFRELLDQDDDLNIYSAF